MKLEISCDFYICLNNRERTEELPLSRRFLLELPSLYLEVGVS